MAETWQDFNHITDEEFEAMPRGEQIELGQRVARTAGIELTTEQAGHLADGFMAIRAHERERHGHTWEYLDREPGG